MCINRHKIWLTSHVLDNLIFIVKVSLIVGKIRPIVLEMHYFEVEPWQQNLNLFGVLKQFAECVVLPFIVGWDYLVCVLGEFLDVLEQSLKSDWVCSSYSMLLGRAVEKYQIWVHKFSELFITCEFLINLAPRNLFILPSDLELGLCKLFPHKNNRNILLFRFPFIKRLYTGLNNTFPIDILG